MSSSPTRILFIGNSYTNRNNLPGLITQLAATAPQPREVETDSIIANGMALKFHWNKGVAMEMLRQGHWDYVVLQEQSTLPYKNPTRMHESVRLFDAAIREHGAKTVLYMTWARQDALERQQEITDAYTSIGKELGAIVVPVGLAWQSVLQEHPELILHEDDKSHPKLTGSYLAACVFYATLFKESPVGFATEVKGLNPQDAVLLQRLAWQAVQTM